MVVGKCLLDPTTNKTLGAFRENTTRDLRLVRYPAETMTGLSPLRARRGSLIDSVKEAFSNHQLEVPCPRQSPEAVLLIPVNEKCNELKLKDWVPPDLCLPPCVFRD